MVSASADPQLHEAAAPVALIPHGATYNRVLKGLSGAAGTAREQLLGPGGELPALLAMPGRAAIDQLDRDCPEAVPFAEITGDLCMERLRISAPMRAAYRESLDVGPEQKLVAVSSTWGPYSLTGTDRSLPERLLIDLPADEFKVAYIPHPNIDADHGGNLIAYMRPKLQNGLIMVPPDEGWRAALIASDCVVGDSGSVSLYAANLGRPVMLAAFAFEEMAAGTPQERFGHSAPRLDREAAPAPQIRSILDGSVERHRLLDDAWSEPSPGPAAQVLSRIYRLLDLAPDAVEPEMLPPPIPIPECEPMNAWHCSIGFEHSAITWARYPASTPRRDLGHLVVDTACRRPQFRGDAAVLLSHASAREPARAEAEARTLLDAYPRSSIVSVRTDRNEALVLERGGGRFRVVADRPLLDLVPSALLRAGRDRVLNLGFGSVPGQPVIEPPD
ncbi:hypothetical protein [Glycomyces salinus]|uniref:hypothetical protein n=1 Tax=Glycomyces salinus TaxID=980294 RepID=UPI0018EDB35B|nr:hypothetical protein [Glycomyces salinus]